MVTVAGKNIILGVGQKKKKKERTDRREEETEEGRGGECVIKGKQNTDFKRTHAHKNPDKPSVSFLETTSKNLSLGC